MRHGESQQVWECYQRDGRASHLLCSEQQGSSGRCFRAAVSGWSSAFLAKTVHREFATFQSLALLPLITMVVERIGNRLKRKPRLHIYVRPQFSAWCYAWDGRVARTINGATNLGCPAFGFGGRGF